MVLMRHGTLEEVIADSVRGCTRKSREQVADELGLSYSNFCRMVNENDSAVSFPARLLVPLMKSLRNYEPLHHVARRCGHVVVNLSRLRVPRGAGADVQNDLHASFSSMMRSIATFFGSRSGETREQAVQDLDRCLGEIIAARKKLEGWKQFELNFTEDAD